MIRKRRIVRRQNLHQFKRSVYVPSYVVTSAGVDTAFKLEATIADLPNFSEFTSLYDQIRISGISVKFIPRFNVAAVGTSAPPSQLMTCLDYDGNGPTTVSGIQQYPNLKVTRGLYPHKRYFKPAILTAAYQTATGSAYVPKWGQFIDAASTTTVHYGLYGMIPDTGTALSYDLEATYYIQCKNVR